VIDWKDYDAVLFDLDGVLTDTARIHASCWQRAFDDFLREWSERSGERFRPFDVEADYLRYVDGKPRYDGVRDFLGSRGIELPQGTPEDAPGHDTVCAVGNRKNELVGEALASEPIDVYQGSLRLLRELRAAGIKTAVVSSSANCAAILRGAGIQDLFDTRMDGAIAAERGIAGKPAPDTFLAAARALGVEPARAVVVEDAISGVQAGRDGGFGLVIGVDRKGDAKSLWENGADIVVNDLADMLG
jgi:alpha,alpha-trehalase